MSELTIVTHATAEDALLADARAVFAAAGETLTDDELRRCTMGGAYLEDGSDAGEFTLKEQLAGLEEQGLWAWVDVPAGVIHVWIGPKATPEDVLHMLAHEVAHVRMGGCDDDGAEERQCEAVAAVAVEAARLTDALRKASSDLPR